MTAVVSAAAGAAGRVIAEFYDATPITAFRATTPRLVNVSVRKQIDETFLKRAVRAYLAPMLPEEELTELVTSGVVVKKFAGGEQLFGVGDPPDGLYLIRRGSVMISRTE